MIKLIAFIIFMTSLAPTASGHDQSDDVSDCFEGQWCMYKTTYHTYRLRQAYDTLDDCEKAKRDLYDDDKYGLLGILVCAQRWD